MLRSALALWLAGWNLLAFGAMGLDKWKARRQKWRIRERTLFLLAVLGGSLGGLAGMFVFHHKTRHRKFLIGFPLILLLQAVILAGWCRYVL